MKVPMNKILWDNTAFNNNYEDIMPLVESIRQHGHRPDEGPVTVQPFGNAYMVIAGRNVSQACAMLGMEEIEVTVIENPTSLDIMRLRHKHNHWKDDVRGGRNQQVHREGY